MLSDAELKRYSRQIPLFGEVGQERLKRTHVILAGAGGLGSAMAYYLAAAGFGRIRIVDCDRVDLSNLNRQILYKVSDLNRDKALSAHDSLRALNPDIKVEARAAIISEDNIDDLVQGCDLIMDGMDGFAARYILNRAALKRRIPLFHGAVSGYQGQATTVVPARTACLRCIFPRAPPDAVVPALGSTCGVIGSIAVTEAVKYVTGKGRLLENRLALWDGRNACLDELAAERNPFCPDCSGITGKAGEWRDRTAGV
ncbi:MAG: HesA/MoeB/ThiF family protein [Methanothrix sp.]|nr:HesA/MoeB/ThiF family protein [Methanothrix sp.]